MKRDNVVPQFEVFFGAWYPHLLRYVCRHTDCRATAEEVVQDVFLDLYKALQANQTIDYPKAWTMRVARRKCGEVRRDVRCVRLDGTHEEALGAPGPGPAEALDRSLDTQRLRGCLSVLTEREEEVLLLRLQSMKFREIGSALGIATSSVNTLLARALEKLRHAFLEPGGAELRERRRHGA